MPSVACESHTPCASYHPFQHTCIYIVRYPSIGVPSRESGKWGNFFFFFVWFKGTSALAFFVFRSSWTFRLRPKWAEKRRRKKNRRRRQQRCWIIKRRQMQHIHAYIFMYYTALEMRWMYRLNALAARTEILSTTRNEPNFSHTILCPGDLVSVWILLRAIYELIMIWDFYSSVQTVDWMPSRTISSLPFFCILFE